MPGRNVFYPSLSESIPCSLRFSRCSFIVVTCSAGWLCQIVTSPTILSGAVERKILLGFPETFCRSGPGPRAPPSTAPAAYSAAPSPTRQTTGSRRGPASNPPPRACPSRGRRRKSIGWAGRTGARGGRRDRLVDDGDVRADGAHRLARGDQQWNRRRISAASASASSACLRTERRASAWRSSAVYASRRGAVRSSSNGCRLHNEGLDLAHRRPTAASRRSVRGRVHRRTVGTPQHRAEPPRRRCRGW